MLQQRTVDAAALRDPVFVVLDVLLVAQAQVFVADALAAGQQRIGELLVRQLRITRDVLEPFR